MTGSRTVSEGRQAGRMPATPDTSQKPAIPAATDRPIATIVGSLPPLRGISPYCRALALALANLGSVDFISFRSMYPSRFYPGHSEVDSSAALPHHPRLRILRTLTWYNPASWVMAAFRIRSPVVHLQWWSPPLGPIYLTLAVLTRLRRRRLITTVHNVNPHEPSRLASAFTRVLCALSHRVIVHTPRSLDALHNSYGIPRRRIRVISHGPLTPPYPPHTTRAQARETLGLPSDAAVILVFGAIRRYKGLDIASRAFDLVSGRAGHARLLVAGVPWGASKDIESLTASPKIIAHLRYIPEQAMADYFLASDLAILPYLRFSGQSGIGMMALSFALPLIVSDVGGLPELVSDRDSVVPPGNADRLAERILQIIADAALADRLRAQSADLARRYGWPNVARETFGVYCGNGAIHNAGPR